MKLRKSLEDRTYQFRTIQKRLLNRFKDKNPSPLNNLDFLLNHTYVQILECGTQIQDYQINQKICAGKLSAALELVVKLLQIRFKIDPQECDVLRAHLCVEESTIQGLDQSENSWEDVTNAQISYMLKNSLTKGGEKSQEKKEKAATNVTTSAIKQLQDVEKLKISIT